MTYNHSFETNFSWNFCQLIYPLIEQYYRIITWNIFYLVGQFWIYFFQCLKVIISNGIRSCSCECHCYCYTSIFRRCTFIQWITTIISNCFVVLINVRGYFCVHPLSRGDCRLVSPHGPWIILHFIISSVIGSGMSAIMMLSIWFEHNLFFNHNKMWTCGNSLFCHSIE